MKLYFHFLSGTRKDEVIVLDVPEGRTVQVGRDPAADLPFNHDFEYPVSRRHASITHRPGGRIVLKDLGSKLGTRVQGRAIERAVVLKSKYRLQFGGELGPLCRFYKEPDVKKCPLCAGPLFKNNFLCVVCHRKVCFTHFDAQYKCCSVCAEMARGAAFEAERAAESAAAAQAAASARRTRKIGAPSTEPDAPARPGGVGKKTTLVASSTCSSCGMPTRPGESLCRHCR